MDIETMMMQQRDNGVCSVIPAGYFAKFADIAKKSAQPARVRKLPVLTVQFDESLQLTDFPKHAHVGWGAIDSDYMPILTFRFQFRELMVYWLASPADEEVWRVMDQWNEVGRMVIAPFFDGQACLISRDFGLVPQAKALRSSWTKQGQKVNDLFLRSASELILSGRLAAMATSDVAAVPRLQRVVACIVATRSTGGLCAPDQVSH